MIISIDIIGGSAIYGENEDKGSKVKDTTRRNSRKRPRHMHRLLFVEFDLVSKCCISCQIYLTESKIVGRYTALTCRPIGLSHSLLHCYVKLVWLYIHSVTYNQFVFSCVFDGKLYRQNAICQFDKRFFEVCPCSSNDRWPGQSSICRSIMSTFGGVLVAP